MDTLVNPVPDAGSDHPFGLVLNIVPIFREISDGITHRMGIFTKDVRLIAAILVLSLHLAQRGIHPRVHVRDAVHSLIMDRTVVQTTDSVPLGDDIWTGTRLVSERPEDHGRMQLVPADHPLGTVHIGRLPGGSLADGVVAMALLISLINNIEPEIVIHGVHLRVIGIMAGSDSIDVMTLHQEDVLQHGSDRNRLSMNGIYVMAVGAFEICQDPVDIEFVPLELNLSEPVTEESSLKSLSGLVEKFHTDRVKIRILSRPKMRVGHNHTHILQRQLFPCRNHCLGGFGLTYLAPLFIVNSGLDPGYRSLAIIP